MSELAREGAQDPRLEELRKAAQWYQIAIGQTERLLDNYELILSSGADLVVLIKALRFQKQMMDEYAEVFTLLMPQCEPVEEGVTAKPSRPRERIKVKPLTKAAGCNRTR
jgi:hypothetical protein